MNVSTGFSFGLESEYLVARLSTFEPLWHDSVTFAELNECLERVRTDDLPSCDDLRFDPPHRRRMPFGVEGYHVPETGNLALDILPKGVEIRTPVCRGVEHALSTFATLHERLQESLARSRLVAVALSHHPTATRFHAPQGSRRRDLWLWAMEAMMTYGPDINIGIPDELGRAIDREELVARIDHYAPAMAALSAGSPFLGGKLWAHRGKIGKSYRTFRRSIVAPPVKFHSESGGGRIEFKAFEMSWRIEDFRNYFSLVLAVILACVERADGPLLKRRATSAERTYDLGIAAVEGMESEDLRARALELITAAGRILPAWGFGTEGLDILATRAERRLTPADELIEAYLALPRIPALLSRLAELRQPQPLAVERLSLCV